ncbi:MAG: hypothetical protein IJ087_09590 [Eggerthellaceae bacterium]|nr:hypothetical protein [Eggerthellaceae bacterium]
MRRIVPHYQAAAPGTGHVSSGGVIVLGVTERKGDGSFIAHGIPKAGKVLDDFWNAAFPKTRCQPAS